MIWLTLPDTGTLVLLTDDGRPALMRLPVVASADDYALQEAVALEVEAVTGWRYEVRALTSTDNPRGWWLVVEWIGSLAQPCTYAEIKDAPVDVYAPDPKCECCRSERIVRSAAFYIRTLRPCYDKKRTAQHSVASTSSVFLARQMEERRSRHLLMCRCIRRIQYCRFSTGSMRSRSPASSCCRAHGCCLG